MKNSDFVNALAEDIDKAGSGGPINIPVHKNLEDDGAEEGKEQDESKPPGNSVADDIQKQFEVDSTKLIEDNEAVIADMVKTLDALKAEISTSSNKVEHHQTGKNE